MNQPRVDGFDRDFAEPYRVYKLLQGLPVILQVQRVDKALRVQRIEMVRYSSFVEKFSYVGYYVGEYMSIRHLELRVGLMQGQRFSCASLP